MREKAKDRLFTFWVCLLPLGGTGDEIMWEIINLIFYTFVVEYLHQVIIDYYK